MLEVDGIDVYYGNVQALWNVSIKVDEGEIVTMVGANGAGKTTTLKTISGLLHPASGSIKFLGEEINKLKPNRIVERGIAHIPEGRRLFPFLTVQENLKLGAFTKKAREKARDSFKWIYELFPILKEREKQLAGTLSGGERQMLAVGRGLMSRPKLLMLDEPSLGLAPILVQKTFEAVRELNEQGVTILLVEQNIHHALEIADTAYLLETGRVSLKGTGKTLLQHDYVKKAYLGL